MSFKIQNVFMVSILIVVLGSACSSSGPDVVPSPAPRQSIGIIAVRATEAPSTAPALETSEGDKSACDNPFYPVADDATWMYASSDGTNSIDTMSADDFGNFTITIEAQGHTFTIDGQCTSAGIIIMNAPGAQTTVSGEGGSSTVSAVNVEGVTLPNDIGQGQQWSQIIEVTTDLGKSTIETHYTAVGFENITVPAGDFYVLKIEQTGTVTVLGRKVEMHGYQWLAEGVGVIRSAWDDAPYLELTMYDIPN
jgi:hypothetical protein